METDQSGNTYMEIDIAGAWIRLTYVETGWAGTPSVRIQLRQAGGRLKQGPEIPFASIGGVVGGVVELLSAHQS